MQEPYSGDINVNGVAPASGSTLEALSHINESIDKSRKWAKRRKELDTCYPLGYNLPVIASFAHKGLERFYRTGNASVIQAIHAAKLRLILSLLDAAPTVEGVRLPALKLHKLKGARNDTWAVTVQANWRVTFRFENGNAHVVNYEDYYQGVSHGYNAQPGPSGRIN